MWFPEVQYRLYIYMETLHGNFVNATINFKPERCVNIEEIAESNLAEPLPLNE